MTTWCIYKHTSPSGKLYIGMTCRDPKIRWQNGNGYGTETKFAKAISKYGWDNFSHEIIEENIPTLEEAKTREVYWVDYYDSYKNGYNSTFGGDTVSLDRETNCPVYQLDYNLNIINEFPTMAEAGRALNIGSSGIMEATREDGDQISAGGYYWCLKEKYTPEWKPRIDLHKKQVICVETGQIFESEIDAANSSGLTQAAISACCYEQTITCQGKHWVFLSNYNENWKPRDPVKKSYPTSKRIICIETEEIYNSISEASAITGINRACIQRACKENRTASNYHFAYYDTYNKETWTSEIIRCPFKHKNKKVICIETGKEYRSARAAGLELNISHTLITNCCCGKQEETHKLHFEYKKE